LTGIVTEWQAFTLWRANYLCERVGHRLVKVGVSRSRVFQYGTSSAAQTEAREMLFKDAIHRIANHSEDSDERLYIMEQNGQKQNSFAEIYPELAADFTAPPGVDINKLMQTNLWIGSKGNVTPLHFDIANNFLCQIEGRKRITCFDPSQTDRLYPTGYGDKIDNTSQVQILEPDFTKHPRYRDAVPTHCILDPGEVIYIPPFWWHQVESLDIATSLNFWWAPRITQCLHPMGIELMRFFHKRDQLSEVAGAVVPEFADFAKFATYCLGRGYKCIALFFAKAELETRCNKDPVSVHKAIEPWRGLLNIAENGDDSQLDDRQVAAVLESLGA
jgi:hypothetical protein